MWREGEEEALLKLVSIHRWRSYAPAFSMSCGELSPAATSFSVFYYYFFSIFVLELQQFPAATCNCSCRARHPWPIRVISAFFVGLTDVFPTQLHAESLPFVGDSNLVHKYSSRVVINCYYKLWQRCIANHDSFFWLQIMTVLLLEITTRLLQMATAITSHKNFYKSRQNSHRLTT